MPTSPESDTSAGISRRGAIKRGVVGAAAAGVVWTAPKIEGLSLRPNYAAAQTGPPGSPITLQFDTASANTAMTSFSCGGTTYTADLLWTPSTSITGVASATIAPSPSAGVSLSSAGVMAVGGAFLGLPTLAPTANGLTLIGQMFIQAPQITVSMPFTCL